MLKLNVKRVQEPKENEDEEGKIPSWKKKTTSKYKV
jgi:hypothetical protein